MISFHLVLVFMFEVQKLVSNEGNHTRVVLFVFQPFQVLDFIVSEDTSGKASAELASEPPLTLGSEVDHFGGANMLAALFMI